MSRRFLSFFEMELLLTAVLLGIGAIFFKWAKAYNISSLLMALGLGCFLWSQWISFRRWLKGD